MSIESDLLARLKADSALSAEVGARVYVDVAPQSVTKPYITIQTISTVNYRPLSTGGVLNASSRVQIDIWAASPSSRSTIAEALRQSLLGVVASELAASGAWANGIGFSGPDHSYLAAPDGSESGTFRGICEAMVTHQVAAV